MANALNQDPIYCDTDGVLKPKKSHVIGVHVVGGSAVTRIKLYDGTDATGPIKFDSGEVAINKGEPFPVEFSVENGLYADITTTGGYVFVDLG